MRWSNGCPGQSRSGCGRSNFCEGPSMATPALARDFKEFLKSLNSNNVRWRNLIPRRRQYTGSDLRMPETRLDPLGERHPASRSAEMSLDAANLRVCATTVAAKLFLCASLLI